MSEIPYENTPYTEDELQDWTYEAWHRPRTLEGVTCPACGHKHDFHFGVYGGFGYTDRPEVVDVACRCLHQHPIMKDGEQVGTNATCGRYGRLPDHIVASIRW
ncbi:MAG: hypothetical protein ACR2QK_00040 [Acidimicrobiales bacterium]